MNIFIVIERNIRDVSADRGMTLNELILKIDMTEGGFYKMLKSGSMKIRTLELISEVLGYPIQSFFDVPGNWKNHPTFKEENTLAEPEAIYKSENQLLKENIEALKGTIKDKERIIELMSK